MNNCTFAGRIGRDAELRRTPGDKAVTNFPVAIDQRRGSEKITLWVECTLWEKRAEALVAYLTKGTSVAVSGEVAINTYKSRDGEQKSNLVLTVREITLLGGGTRQAGNERPTESRTTSKPADKQPTSDDAAAFDDDIPF